MNRRDFLGCGAGVAMLVSLPFVLFGKAADGAAAMAESVAEMPLVAWGWPFELREADVAHYRLVRDCGCNYTIQWVGAQQSISRCLDAAAEAGIKLILHSTDVLQSPETTIPLIRQHRALGGYYLCDEPPVQKMPKLGELARRIRAQDGEHPVYMNWFGRVDDPERWFGVPTFEEYLETSIREVPTGLYTFDVYPIYADRLPTRPLVRALTPLFLRKDWYASLEAVSLRARRDKVPFWAFASIVPIRNHRLYDNPMPTCAHLRLQQYSNLAYGAQGLQYYLFRSSAKNTAEYLSDGAPLSPEGKINPSYWRLEEVNRELQARAWVFLGSQPVRIRHAGETPEGTTAYDPQKDRPKFVTKFEANGDLLISVLKGDKHAALVVVNRNPNAVSAFTAAFAPSVRRVGRDGRSMPASDGDYVMDVGDAEIFVFQLTSGRNG